MDKERFFELVKDCFVPVDLQEHYIITIDNDKKVLFIFNDESMLNAFLQRSHKVIGNLFDVSEPDEFLTMMIELLQKYPDVILGLITTCNSDQLVYLPFGNYLELLEME